MKYFLLIVLVIILSSCYKEKIVYVEQESKTLEGTWDIDGVWFHSNYDFETKTTIRDSLYTGRDTFKFFYNRTNEHSSNLYMSLSNSDTVYHFNRTLDNYPFNRYSSSTNIADQIRLLNFSISRKEMLYNPNGYFMHFYFEYAFEEDDNSKPIIFYEDETNVSFSIEYDYKRDEYRKSYVFIGKGKRLK